MVFWIGVPVKEFRIAVLRSFERMSVGANLFVATGYTGQSTEVLALPGETAPFERIVGVRLPSYVSISWSYRYRPRNAK